MRRLILAFGFAAALLTVQINLVSAKSFPADIKHSVYAVSEWTEYVYLGDLLFKITYHDDGSVTMVQASHGTQGD